MAGKTIIGILFLTMVLVTTSMAGTNTYVSLKGNFYIIYPDDWAQVDYRLVDAYLLSDKVDKPILDYEAVFAYKDAPFFFSREYLVLTVDTVGDLKEWQIDSVLIELVRSFGKKVQYNKTADYLVDPEPNLPSYDTLTKTVSILNEVNGQGQNLKKNLLMMKFYDRGIATFYFYSPDSTFETSKFLFERIISSFSTENVEAALPKESFKVADLEVGESAAGRETKKSKNIYLYIGAALVLLIIILIRRLR